MKKKILISDLEALGKGGSEMTPDFHSIIETYRYEDENNSQFAKRLGVHPSMIKYWEKGMIPKPATVRKIIKSLKLDNHTAKVLKDAFSYCSGKGEDGGMKPKTTPLLPTIHTDERAQILGDTFVQVPVADAVTKNNAVVTAPERSWLKFKIEYLDDIGTRYRNLFLFEIRERTMVPSFMPGDCVLVDTGKRVLADDEVYLVNLENVLRLKRLTLLPDGKVRLVTDADPHGFLDGDPETDLDIVGQVVWLCRKVA